MKKEKNGFAQVKLDLQGWKELEFQNIGSEQTEAPTLLAKIYSRSRLQLTY